MKQDRRGAFITLFLLLSGTIVAQVKSNPSDQALAGLTGMVTNSVTGEPLGYAHIDLESSGGQNRIRYGALTTPDGHFAIRGVPAGRYQISLKYRKYVEDATSIIAIELGRGEQVHDVRLKLVPPGAILGQVVDEAGAPFEDASVRVESQASTQTTFTDERGQFRIGGLRPGSYWIVASPPQSRLPAEIRTDGTVELNYAPTYYPSALKRENASHIEVSGGAETSGIEITVLTFPIFKVSGWVSGMPKDALCADVMLSTEHSGSSVRLDSDRRFTLWRLPPGNYSLSAQCQDLAGRPLRSASVSFEMSSSDIENLELRVAPPFSLSGQITIDNVSEGTSSTFVNKFVRLQDPLSTVGGLKAAIALDGTFRFASVILGRYRVRIDGFRANVYVRSVQVGLSEALDGTIDLQNGPLSEPVRIIASQADGRISGTVHGPELLVDKAIMVLINERFVGDFPRTAPIRPDRSYLFEGVAPGKYKILAIDQTQLSSGWQDSDLAQYKAAIEEVELLGSDQITRDVNVFVPDANMRRSYK